MGYIRINITHLVRLVCLWKCLTGTQNYRLKEFYVRCVMLLVGVSCIEEFENILLDNLTVSMSQTEGEKIESTGKCPAEEARNRLLNNIKGTLVTEIHNVLGSNMNNCSLLYENSDEELEDADEIEVSTINKFSNKIKSKSVSNSLVEGDRISPYYLPKYTENILRLCKEFP